MAVDVEKMKRARGASSEPRRRSDADWKGFLARCREVLDEIDDLPDAAADFAEGVQERIEKMRGWVEDRQHVTEPMERALSNIADGVAKWAKHRR